MNAWTLIVSGLSMLAGVALGAWLWAWRIHRQARARLHIPAHWPLRARRIVSGNEKDVWAALKNIFHDHVVMVKVPVLRYTKLHDTEKFNVSAKAEAAVEAENERLQELLINLYTTFTIVTNTGKVIGCVDLLGKVALPQASRDLKEGLLSDCGIAYLMVSASDLPDASKLRALFLDELPVERIEHQVTRGGDSVFQADLTAFTKQHAHGPRLHGADFI